MCVHVWSVYGVCLCACVRMLLKCAVCVTMHVLCAHTCAGVGSVRVATWCGLHTHANDTLRSPGASAEPRKLSCDR